MDALVDTQILTLLQLVPCAALTAAGVVLWRRWRSAATAMIALGFAAGSLSVASGLFVTYKTHAVLSEMTSTPPLQHDTFFVVAHYGRFSLLGVIGMWVAAAGTLRHISRRRKL